MCNFRCSGDGVLSGAATDREPARGFHGAAEGVRDQAAAGKGRRYRGRSGKEGATEPEPAYPCAEIWPTCAAARVARFIMAHFFLLWKTQFCNPESPECSLFLKCVFCLHTGWFTLKKTNLFLGECSRRFVDSDREVLHTSSMCHCEDLTCPCLFLFL